MTIDQAADATDLIFQGRVVEIIPWAQLPGPPRWRVTIAVDQVIQGSFTGDRFAFLVHSPVKSGLAPGGFYTIRAKHAPGGYTVDPLQWLPRK